MAKTAAVDGVRFRSVKPQFGFRVRAGRDGKLMFVSHADTILTDPGDVARARQYVPKQLIEVND